MFTKGRIRSVIEFVLSESKEKLFEYVINFK